MTGHADDPLRALIAATRQSLSSGAAALRAAYEAHPRTATVLKGRAHLVDEAIIGLWRACEMPPQATLAAVGGYGRGELFPCSDVDLLILLPESADAGSSSGRPSPKRKGTMPEAASPAALSDVRQVTATLPPAARKRAAKTRAL